MQRKRIRNRKKADPLSVQLRFKVRAPRGAKISRKVLNQAFHEWVETGEMHPAITIEGIFWRNPQRKGSLGAWRFADGSQGSKKPSGPVSSLPSGDFDDARLSLKEALRKLQPF